MCPRTLTVMSVAKSIANFVSVGVNENAILSHFHTLVVANNKLLCCRARLLVFGGNDDVACIVVQVQLKSVVTDCDCTHLPYDVMRCHGGGTSRPLDMDY